MEVMEAVNYWIIPLSYSKPHKDYSDVDSGFFWALNLYSIYPNPATR